MSKWRPTESGCLYVIPDIHGNFLQLYNIFSRILPLRFTGGVKDMIVFLGDYIDRGDRSACVINNLIDLKKSYPEQCVFLCGNHEFMILPFISGDVKTPSESENILFRVNGGGATIKSYMRLSGLNGDHFGFDRIRDIIPDDHKEFFKGLLPFFETDKYKFVHGGCNPYVPLEDHKTETLVWDRSLFNSVIESANNNIYPKWEKTIVTGHNSSKSKGKPFISDKFIMLDCIGHGDLHVLELNSMTGFISRKGKNRMISYTYK